MPELLDISLGEDAATFLRDFNLKAYRLRLGEDCVLRGNAESLEYFAKRLSFVGAYEEEDRLSLEVLFAIADVIDEADKT